MNKDWFEQINIEDIKNKSNIPPGQIKNFLIIIAVIFVVFLVLIFKPWFSVNSDEVGIVLRMGKFHRVVSPGLKWRLPRPIETVETVKVEQMKRIEVGFRTITTGPQARYRDIPEESQMLTGDENILMAEVIVQYRVSDPISYLFNVANVEETLKDITEAVERQVIGDYAIDAALTWGRQEIEQKIQDELQKVCDTYEMGILIFKVQLQDTHAPEEVEPAFLAVTSAREDQSRFVNEAEGYRNGEIPKAEARVQKLLQEAEAYRAEQLAESKGEVERFSALLREFKTAPEVTRTRLYLETMENILSGKAKVIIGTQEKPFQLLDVTPKGFGDLFGASKKEEETQ